MAKKKETEEEVPAAEQQTENDDWDTPASAPVTADEWQTEMETQTVSIELQVKKHTGTFNPDIAKFLFYGESGTGKTRLASTFPDTIFADVDKGMSSVTEQVDQVEIDTFRQLEGFYQLLKYQKVLVFH